MRLVALVLLGLFALRMKAQKPLRFSGSVSAGEHFERPIGNGLSFELVPDGGWDIQVRRAGEDLTRCVSIPLHGPTALQITAWKFSPVGGEKLREHVHGFDFTLNSADQTRACAELDVIEATRGEPRMDPKTGILTVGTPGYRQPPLGHGELVVTKVELSLGAIEKMSFVVWCTTPFRR